MEQIINSRIGVEIRNLIPLSQPQERCPRVGLGILKLFNALTLDFDDRVNEVMLASLNLFGERSEIRREKFVNN